MFPLAALSLLQDLKYAGFIILPADHVLQEESSHNDAYL